VFNSTRRDRWVFGDRDSGAYLLKFAWTTITRHTLVKGWASPDDPALANYWAARRRRGRPPLDRARLRLLHKQRGRCPLCGQLLLHTDHEPEHPDEWERWITATRKAVSHRALTFDTGPGETDTITVFRLVHTHCRDRPPGGTGSGPALPQP
jgi:RNA-directed DNA polymerase